MITLTTPPIQTLPHMRLNRRTLVGVGQEEGLQAGASNPALVRFGEFPTKQGPHNRPPPPPKKKALITSAPTKGTPSLWKQPYSVSAQTLTMGLGRFQQRFCRNPADEAVMKKPTSVIQTMTILHGPYCANT